MMDVSELYNTQSSDSNDNSLIDPKRGTLQLVMTVEIAEDEYGQIIVYEKDKPENLAAAFCKLHDLGNDVAVVLKEHIINNIQSTPAQPQPQFTLPEPANIQAKQVPRLSKSRDTSLNQIKTGKVEMDNTEVRPDTTTNSRRETNIKRLQGRYASQSLDYNSNSSRQETTNSSRRRETTNSVLREKETDNKQSDVFQRLASSKCQKPEPKQSEREPRPRHSRTKSTSMPRGLTPGVRLYHKGLMAQQRKTEKIDAIKQQLKAKETEGATFSPQLSPQSKKLQSSRREPSVERGLLQRAENARLQLGLKIQQKEEKDSEQCSFHPQITKKGRQSGRRTMSQTFNGLYQEAAERQKKLDNKSEQILNEQCTFQPNINARSRARNMTTIETLHNGNQERDKYLQIVRAQKEADSLYDEVTGQPLFKPKVGRSPKSPGPDLVFRNGFTEANMTNESGIAGLSRTLNTVQSQHRTDKIFAKMKKDRYQQIFQSLKPDQTGQIRYQTIRKDMIESRIYNVIEPLLENLEEIAEPIDFDEFSDAMDRLMAIVSTHEKSIILSTTRKVRSPENRLTFQPTLLSSPRGPPSQRRRNSATAAELYNRLMLAKKKKEDKVKARKEELEQAEMTP